MEEATNDGKISTKVQVKIIKSENTFEYHQITFDSISLQLRCWSLCLVCKEQHITVAMSTGVVSDATGFPPTKSWTIQLTRRGRTRRQGWTTSTSCSLFPPFLQLEDSPKACLPQSDSDRFKSLLKLYQAVWLGNVLLDLIAASHLSGIDFKMSLQEIKFRNEARNNGPDHDYAVSVKPELFIHLGTGYLQVFGTRLLPENFLGVKWYQTEAKLWV